MLTFTSRGWTETESSADRLRTFSPHTDGLLPPYLRFPGSFRLITHANLVVSGANTSLEVMDGLV